MAARAKIDRGRAELAAMSAEVVARSHNLPANTLELIKYNVGWADKLALVRIQGQMYFSRFCLKPRNLLRIIEPDCLPGILENIEQRVPLKVRIYGRGESSAEIRDCLYCPCHYTFFTETCYKCEGRVAKRKRSRDTLVSRLRSRAHLIQRLLPNLFNSDGTETLLTQH